jgi:hypothetical protein
MNRIYLTLAAGLPALALSVGAPAATPEYKAEKSRVEAEYKAAKVNCKALKGTEKRDCLKTAKADHEAAEKKLKASASTTSR